MALLPPIIVVIPGVTLPGVTVPGVITVQVDGKPTTVTTSPNVEALRWSDGWHVLSPTSS